MTYQEAIAWLNGERSACNYVPQDPIETWQTRIAEADAAMTQQAYWMAKAHSEGRMKWIPTPGRLYEACVLCKGTEIFNDTKCLACESSPGFMQVGVTRVQLDAALIA